MYVRGYLQGRENGRVVTIGEEMWRVDAYQIRYYSRGIEVLRKRSGLTRGLPIVSMWWFTYVVYHNEDYRPLIWIRHSLQASMATTHRQFWVLFFIILDFFSLFSISTYPVNSIAKEIFWADLYRRRLFFRAEIYRGRLFLGAKQEGLTIVHFLNKLMRLFVFPSLIQDS